MCRVSPRPDGSLVNEYKISMLSRTYLYLFLLLIFSLFTYTYIFLGGGKREGVFAAKRADVETSFWMLRGR